MGRLSALLHPVKSNPRNLDKDAVRSAIATSAIDPDIDEHDLAHNAVFYFGIPTNSTFEIIGVTGSDFIVKYTTDILDAIQQLS